MSDIRKKGIAYLRRALGTVPSEAVAVSKFYRPEESWTGNSAWWFDLPIKRVKSRKGGHYFLLGEVPKGGFVVLKVRNKFLLDNLRKFETRYRGLLRLHIGAEGSGRFTDERGKGRVDFSRFVQKV